MPPLRFRQPWLIVFLSVTIPCAAAVQTSTYRVHLGPIPEHASPYVYLPFEIPANTEEIVVELNYDRANGQNAIDFAIFDARFSGRNDDLTGYRGKNPNRAPLISIVGRAKASYGHLAGPMPIGTWRVMFYVYKTLPAGVDVTLTISVSVEDLRSTNNAGWLRGDLHAHTLHSDGTWTVTSLAGAAQQAGLDFIAITDHNTASHHAEMDSMPKGGPLLLKGMEMTTYGGHANVWGLPAGTVVEHRQLPGDESAMQAAVDQAHRAGALISVNHPFADCKACDWAFDRKAVDFDGIEVWNAAWGPEDQKALEWWEGLLKSGRHITAIGSSDSHGPQNPLGLPTLYVASEALETASILQSVRSGRVTITVSPEVQIDLEIRRGAERFGPGQEVAASADRLPLTANLRGVSAGEIVLYSSEGEVKRWAVTSRSEQLEIEVSSSAKYYRLEGRDSQGGMIALTNPIWLRRQ